MRAQPFSTEDVLAEFERRMQAQAAEPQIDQKLSYLLGAAVLHVVDLGTLNPWLPLAKAIDPLQELFDYTTPAIGWRHRHLRSLKLEIRRPALAWLWRFGKRSAMRDALAANPGRTRTDVQVAFEQWLDGHPFDLETMSFDRLVALSQLYDWGLNGFGGLPDRSAVTTASARRSAIAMFEHLVDENFVGRIAELQRLRDYVGVVSLSLWERVRSTVGQEARPPLVIYGPGGVGKTALIGKFLLEHVSSRSSVWFPFAYLPFDSETLDVREPYTILLSAAGQLSAAIGALAPTPGESVSEKFRTLVAEYRDRRAQLRQRATSHSQDTRLHTLSALDDELSRAFGEFLEGVAEAASGQQKASRLPVLLVFDTFEEVYYRAREDLVGLWRMLDVVRRRFPRLRVIIAGRGRPRPVAPDERNWIEELSLDTLSGPDSQRLLISLGITDTEAARSIARQIGGNPLSLRLAARVAQRENATGAIDGLTTRRYWLLGVAEDIVQGQLYRRILDHIHDPDVRTLAHPGMVLRRVTPGIIRRVLAPACGLGQIDEQRADRLFDELRLEHALVRLDFDQSLRYREEVRRPILAMLISDKPSEVKALHQAAIAYYLPSTDSSERAEELYHRLMLGDSPSVLAERWIQGVESHLITAVEELPALQQSWLASRMSIELSKETVALADTEVWESIVGQKAFAALRYSEPNAILSMLAERNERSAASPLFAIEARAWLALHQPERAASLLDRALQGYPLMGNRGRLAELLWLRAQSQVQTGKPEEARETLTRLAEAAARLDSPLPVVQAYAELVDLEPTAEMSPTKEALAVQIRMLKPAEIDRERALVRLALVRLGPAYPATLSALAPLVVGDFIFMLRQSLIDIAPVAARLRKEPDLSLSDGEPNADAVAEAVRRTLDRLMDGGADPRVARVLLDVMGAEGASLAGATLAGLDSYREPWELAAPLETAL